MKDNQAKQLDKYANKWVALVGGKVIASGKQLREVQEQIAKKRVKNYVFHLVTAQPLAIQV